MQDAPEAESAKDKVNVGLPDKQRCRRRAEGIAVLAKPGKSEDVEEARFVGAARFSVSICSIGVGLG